MEATCKNCTYFESGVCRINPPQEFMSGGYEDWIIKTEFPDVEDHWWCGKHIKKKEIAPQQKKPSFRLDK